MNKCLTSVATKNDAIWVYVLKVYTETDVPQLEYGVYFWKSESNNSIEHIVNDDKSKCNVRSMAY